MPNNNVGIPHISTPMLDSQGYVSKDWYIFLQLIWSRTGAGNGTIDASTLPSSGVSTQFLDGDAVFRTPDYPVGANPTTSIGLAASNGSAATFMRSDAAPALSQGIAPTWTAAHAFSAGLTGTTAALSGAVSGDSLTAVNGFGCNSKAAQTEVTVNAAVAGTASTNVAPFGYTTAAQADAIVTVLNQIRAALIADGILV